MQPIPLKKLSVIIPAKNEEGCIASTVEHLHLELSLKKIPHEIVVVDDGSTDRTWEILQECARTDEALRPVKNPAPHGFGRAIVRGLDSMAGDAAVIMMADESDDCRDVVRYWEKLRALQTSSYAIVTTAQEKIGLMESLRRRFKGTPNLPLESISRAWPRNFQPIFIDDTFSVYKISDDSFPKK